MMSKNNCAAHSSDISSTRFQYILQDYSLRPLGSFTRFRHWRLTAFSCFHLTISFAHYLKIMSSADDAIPTTPDDAVIKKRKAAEGSTSDEEDDGNVSQSSPENSPPSCICNIYIGDNRMCPIHKHEQWISDLPPPASYRMGSPRMPPSKNYNGSNRIKIHYCLSTSCLSNIDIDFFHPAKGFTPMKIVILQFLGKKAK